VVTTLYLMKHPEEVQDFNDYADVHAQRLINHTKVNGISLTAFLSTERIADIENTYMRVKAHPHD
jgi:hypothetical protein